MEGVEDGILCAYTAFLYHQQHRGFGMYCSTMYKQKTSVHMEVNMEVNMNLTLKVIDNH